MLVEACSMIQLFCPSPLKVNQTAETLVMCGAMSCELCNFCTTFFHARLAAMHWPKFSCVVLMLDLNAYSSNLVHLSDAPVANFGAYGIHLACQRDTFVGNISNSLFCIVILFNLCVFSSFCQNAGSQLFQIWLWPSMEILTDNSPFFPSVLGAVT